MYIDHPLNNLEATAFFQDILQIPQSNLKMLGDFLRSAIQVQYQPNSILSLEIKLDLKIFFPITI